MLSVISLPMAERYFKKLKDKNLKKAYLKAITQVRENPEIGDRKSGDLKDC
jgi:mRNA interferase RelE/StbE